MIDRSQWKVLLMGENGKAKWHGPWAPHSDYALSEEDAVQLLRWNNYSTGFSKNPKDFGGEKQLQLWIDMFARKEAACDTWLKEHGITEPFDPWWTKDPAHPATRRIMVP